MLYSKSSEYAIQAMLHLAEHHESDLGMVSTIAEACNIPRQFLAKLVQTLARRRLIESFRGRKGGIRLARSPESITLLEIVNAIEGPPQEKEKCVIGLDVCSEDAICPLHIEWMNTRNLIRDTLEHQTLASMVAGLPAKREELAQQLHESGSE